MQFPLKKIGIISVVGIVFLLGGIFLYLRANPSLLEGGSGLLTTGPASSAEHSSKEDLCSSFEASGEQNECMQALELVFQTYAEEARSVEKQEVSLLRGEDRETAGEVSGMFWVVGVNLEFPVATPEGDMKHGIVIADLQENKAILYQLTPETL